MKASPPRPAQGRMPPELVGRFLGAMDLHRPEPTRLGLQETVRAYLSRIPFENVSKLYRWNRFGFNQVPDTASFLEGIEHGFGGTCFSNNYHLFRLLEALGFAASFGGASMREANAHAVVRVRVDGQEFLVDAGYAAPFLEPLPMDLLEEYHLELGWDRYVLHPKDPLGRSRLDLHRQGVLKHGYTVVPGDRSLEDFHQPITDSFQPGSTFMGSVLLARFHPGYALYIHNFSLLEYHGREIRRRDLKDRKELVKEAHRHFGIPEEVLRETFDNLSTFQDAWN